MLMPLNETAALSRNLQVYATYVETRNSASTLDGGKTDAPPLWDTALSGDPVRMATPAAMPAESLPTLPQDAPHISYASADAGDAVLLGQVNDRLKVQARRYPHPLSNDISAFG